MWAVYGLVITGVHLHAVPAGGAVPAPPHVTGYRPTVAIIVPAYNEPDIAQDAGSLPDRGLSQGADPGGGGGRQVHRRDAAADQRGAEEYPELNVIPAPVNRGKRHAMATGIAAARRRRGLRVHRLRLPGDARRGEAPSSSTSATRKSVRWRGIPTSPTLGRNVLTRMQAMQYYIAFRIYKSAEALFGSVMCCSGCFSAYRRDAVAPVSRCWLDQTFLGQPSTFGDDRSLTNFVLQPMAGAVCARRQATPTCPSTCKQFLRQQLRWKKSLAARNPQGRTGGPAQEPGDGGDVLLSIILPLLAPQVVLRAMVVQPHFIASCRTGTSAGWR